MDYETNRVKIQNLNPELSLNQRAYLLDMVVKVWPHISEDNKTKIWANSEFLTERKYGWLKQLLRAAANYKSSADRWLARQKVNKALADLINL